MSGIRSTTQVMLLQSIEFAVSFSLTQFVLPPCAAAWGHENICQLLLTHRFCDVEWPGDNKIRDKGKRKTKLACKKNSEDVYGNTPLHWAMALGRFRVCDLLIKARADTTVVNKGGETPASYLAFSIGKQLRKASEADDVMKIHTILLANERLSESFKGDVEAFTQCIDATDHVGNSALMCAAKAGACNACFELIHLGAKVSHKNKYGWTALHCAAAKGHADIVALLMVAGTPNSNNNSGDLPITKARYACVFSLKVILSS